MGDLKTYFDKAVLPDHALGGQGITGSGSDPNADGGGGPAGLDPIHWPNPVVPTLSGEESSNSVSGLPAMPNRFEPTETPPEPPSLQDRNPGTIDQR